MRTVAYHCNYSINQSTGHSANYNGLVNAPFVSPHASLSENSNFIRLEIKAETLQRLISREKLMVEELRGLDKQAHSRIRQILLNSLAEEG